MSHDRPDRIVLERPDPPATLEALLTRAVGLAGLRVADLARRVGLRVPRQHKFNKGFLGVAVELALGASAKSDPEPDFPALGVELKTLPIRPDGAPTEDTYVCQAALDGRDADHTFATSTVGHKLAKVLFVPYVASGDIPLAERRLAMPFLWVRDAADEARLAADWQSLSGRIRRGEADTIGGAEGLVLHLRPKALSASERTRGLGEDGWLVPVAPKAWYLRRTFTHALVQRAFGPTPAPPQDTPP